MRHARHVGVLLDRRVIGLQDCRQRLRHVSHHAASRTEVEQHRPAVWQQHDVVGRDVAVVDLMPVQDVQGTEQGLDKALQPGLVRRTVHAPPHVLQRAPVVVGHGHVRRAVLLPEPVDLHERWVVKARKEPRFVHERAQTPRKGFGVGFTAQGQHRTVGALDQRGRHVLLDGHVPHQGVIQRKVHDAEAARPEHALHLEFAQ